MPAKALSIFDREILSQAVVESFKKLNPLNMLKNPVMFVTEVGAAMTTASIIFGPDNESLGFGFQIAVWLWFTVLFANFAEAVAEGRGKAQANALRKTRTQTIAHRLLQDGLVQQDIAADKLRKGDEVVVSAGETIPADGEVIQGVASVDESAITGESAPVIRESGGDRNSVTGGTRVLSDFLIIRVTANPGESFLDHMIRLVEGAQRQKTPNEIALTILLAALTIIFLVVILSLKFFGMYSGVFFSITVLTALLVCLIPTTIGGLLSAIGIAGIDRLVQKNVLAMSGRAAEAAGDVDVLLLDKTGTITLGDRQATEFIPAYGVRAEELADAAQLASLADETPEGRSIVVLAKQYGLRARTLSEMPAATFLPFTAETRMSTLSARRASPSSSACSAVRIICRRIRPWRRSPPAGRLVKSQKLLGPAGNAHRLVADTLQVAVDLDHRQDKAQIDGHGLLLGQQFVGHLVQLALRGVDGGLVLLDVLAETFVALQKSFHRGVDGQLRKCGHRHELIFEFGELLMKVDARHDN